MRLFLETRGLGPPLVLVHGWGSNGTVWEDFTPHLERDWRTVTLDLPGSGRSPPLPAEFTLASVTNCLLTNTPTGGVWLGWSLGGLLAMNLAARHPDHVSGLGLIATTPRFCCTDDWPHGVPKAAILDLEARVRAKTVGALARFADLAASGGARPKAVADYLRERMFRFGECNSEALIGGLKVLADADLRSQARDIGCPVLLVFGEHDPLLPVGAAAAIAAWFAEARWEVIRAAAHAPFVSHGRETLRIFREFFGGQHALTRGVSAR